MSIIAGIYPGFFAKGYNYSLLNNEANLSIYRFSIINGNLFIYRGRAAKAIRPIKVIVPRFFFSNFVYMLNNHLLTTRNNNQ